MTTIPLENEAKNSDLTNKNKSPILSGYFTYKDYITWDDEVRYELIDGIAYALAAPSPIHQDVCRELTLIIGNHLKGKKCKLYFAPYDVRLNADTADDIVLQPDIVVICDKTLEDSRGYKGSPSLIVEITSPSTAYIDLFVKFQKYLKAQVPEYWIVEPEKKTINVFTLEADKYNCKVYNKDAILTSQVLEGLLINLSDVFTFDKT